MKIFFFVIFLLISSNANAEAEYFSSGIKNHPRVTAIVYQNQVIFQNLLNKRYVYTIPYNAEYELENGQKINVKNGIIIDTTELKYDTLFALGISSSTFFNQLTKSCNVTKFYIAKTMLAMNCDTSFHQYQMLPLMPDFIRMIIASKYDVARPKKCTPIFANEEDLLAIEAKTDDAILQERQLEEQKQIQLAQGQGEKLESKKEKDLKAAKKEIKQLKPWEFGLNQRETILNSLDNKAELKDDKIVFYISYFNDIGCIPYEKMKTLSCSEYAQYGGLFLDTYYGVSPFNEDQDDKSDVLVQIKDEVLISYSQAPIEDWKYQMSQCKLNDQKTGTISSSNK